MITPIDLGDLYQGLCDRISGYAPECCAEISLKLPENFNDELAYYKLVTWAYVLFAEAAVVPLKFLVALPPLKRDESALRTINPLRTYIVHNLSNKERKDRKTIAVVQRWFKDACGRKDPETSKHYSDCCFHLAKTIVETLNGAIQACDLFDDPVDGTRLLTDFRDWL